MYQWSNPQLNTAENATQTPHVLTLQIGTVAPAIDLNGNLVFACPHVLCDIELGWRHGVLTIAYLLAIHPKVHG